MSFPGDFYLRAPETGLGPITASNDQDVLTFIAATGKWGGRPVPGGGGGAGVPFSNGVYLDENTLVALSDQNGGNGTPWADFATALAEVAGFGAGALLVASYNAAAPFDLATNLWVVSAVEPSPAAGFPTIDLVNLGDVTITGGVGTGFLGLDGVSMGAFDGTAHSFDIYLRGGAQVLGTITEANGINIDDGLIEAAECSGLTAFRGRFGGDLTVNGTEITIKESVFVGLATITFTGVDPGVVIIDQASLRNFHESGATIVNGGVRVSDGPAWFYMFGAANSDTGEFFNPGFKFGNTVPAPPTFDYWSNNQSHPVYAHYIRVRVPGGFAGNAQSYQLFVGTTLAGLAPTNLEANLAANDESGVLVLDTELVEIPVGGFLAVQFAAGGLSMNSLPCEIWVGAS